MAGNLYLPKNMEQGKKYPAIIILHPGGGVKEQTVGLYAKSWRKRALSLWPMMLPIREPANGCFVIWKNPEE
ncbi:MAG: alpha/beta hydrolase [Selenomonadaceae bacterium]|nr:alpha/beta hydrolase [Selenomonadaceae bacterium]